MSTEQDNNRAEEDADFQHSLAERVYVIHVCGICASDRIVSTEADSWCEDCQKWMSAETVIVSHVPDNPVVRAAIQAAQS